MVEDNKIVSPVSLADRAVTVVDQDNTARAMYVWPSGFLGVVVSDQYTRPFDSSVYCFY